jgi:uncharacterized membrane protein
MANTLLTTAAKSAAGQDSGVARALDRLPTMRTNVSSAERWFSLAAGGTLVGLGATGKTPTLLSLLAGGYLLNRAATGNCPMYQALGVSTSGATAPSSVIAAGHGTKVEHSVVVNKPVDEVYAFWRDFENLPRFMTHLIDVDTTTDGQSRWRARGPLGLSVEWHAEIVTDRPNEAIGWKSLQGSDVDATGSVHFRTVGPNRTEVRVSLKYDPPAGQLGTAVARLIGFSPEEQIKADMARFKQVMESTSSPK